MKQFALAVTALGAASLLGVPAEAYQGTRGGTSFSISVGHATGSYPDGYSSRDGDRYGDRGYRSGGYGYEYPNRRYDDEYDYDSRSRHRDDHREHRGYHRNRAYDHDDAHEDGFYNRRDHRAYHRALRRDHREVHRELPRTRHDHDDW